MRGKRLAGAGALALALTAAVGAPAQAANAPRAEAPSQADISCPAGQKIAWASPPWGTLHADGATFTPSDPSTMLTCKDARTETTTGTTTTVTEVLTTRGEGINACCPDGMKATSGKLTNKFQHWKGDYAPWDFKLTPDGEGYVVTRESPAGLYNITVELTCTP